MMTKRAGRLALAFFGSFGLTACFAADEPAKTAATPHGLLSCGPIRRAQRSFLDDKKIGTSGNLFHVEPGAVTIRVELDGHLSSTRR